MKKHILYPALIVAMFAGMTSCKKDTAAKTTAGHYLNASSSTIGAFSATGLQVGSAGAAGAKLEIYAEDASGHTLTLYVNPYSGATGAISLSGGGETGGVYRSGSTYISSGAGNIVITATSPDIVGTFNYTGTDGSTFTGSFDVAAP